MEHKRDGKRFIARSGKIISFKEVEDLQKFENEDNANSKRFINVDLKKSKHKPNLFNKNREK
jgi:hypothetical protein